MINDKSFVDEKLTESEMNQTDQDKESGDEVVFEVFPLTYKTVSAYGDPEADMQRKARDLGSRVPSLSKEMIRERELKNQLKQRVEKVVEFETRLAQIGDTFEEDKIEGRAILGSWVQRLVMVRNQDLVPVQLSPWVEELEQVVEEVGEEVVTDHILWSLVGHWWGRRVEGGQEECAERVHQLLQQRVERAYVAQFMGTRQNLTKTVKEFLIKEKWVNKISVELLDLMMKDPANSGTMGISAKAGFIQNMFLLDQMDKKEIEAHQKAISKVTDIILQDPESTTAILKEIQDIAMLVRIILQFSLQGMSETEKESLKDKFTLASGREVEDVNLEDSLVDFLTVELGARIAEVSEGEGGRSTAETVTLLLLQTRCHRGEANQREPSLSTFLEC